MKRLVRAGIALSASTALLVVMGGTALAGGWAEATIVSGGDPPVAGEEGEIRVSLLQHGITAVDWGEVQLSATHPETGEAIVVEATSLGGGRWSAAVTFPTDGDWRIGVRHSDLETSGPMLLTVGSEAPPSWLSQAVALAVFAAAAAVVVGGMVALRSRDASTGARAREAVRAGG